jgi:hypothetical protein
MPFLRFTGFSKGRAAKAWAIWFGFVTKFGAGGRSLRFTPPGASLLLPLPFPVELVYMLRCHTAYVLRAPLRDDRDASRLMYCI